MKKILLLTTLAIALVNCKKQEETTPEVITPEKTYTSFGTEITKDNAITKEQMLEKFASMQAGDTIPVKFSSTILNVCQKKGCWMEMDLEGEKEAFVRFTDYGFFVPLDASNQESIIEGKAFLSIVTVDELKHYAKDAGKTQEEIDAIVEPKITYALQADGVLIEDKIVSTESTETKQ